MELLLSGVVERIVINDSDRAIYSIWKAISERNEEFQDLIWSVPLNIAEWERQRSIYVNSSRYSLEYGFAAFYLNRTNHSGILSAGPIGGMEQENWKLDVRFKREDLVNKVRTIGELKKQIKVYGRDIFGFMRNQMPRFKDKAFAYFDPPYYKKGKVLYKNSFKPSDHEKLSNEIHKSCECPWIVSYDDVTEISDLYKEFPSIHFHLGYSLANNGKGREVMFFKEQRLVPTSKELAEVGAGGFFSA